MTDSCFACTRCGLCCTGWLPLTLSDALAHADKFPLAVAWMSEEPQAFEPLSVQLDPADWGQKGKAVRLSLAPVCYIPPSWTCPSLGEDSLCSVQNEKPLRCRTMPFYPWHKEAAQAAHLIPRKGWKCDVTGEAPVVYADKKIVDAENFTAEREQLMQEKPVLQAYAKKMALQNGAVASFLKQAARRVNTERFVVSFASLLRSSNQFDIVAIARKQHPVLLHYASLTKDDPSVAAYHSYYSGAAQELAWFAQQDK